ncbi:unnamed protein product, partial [Medioppia subpectinata]
MNTSFDVNALNDKNNDRNGSGVESTTTSTTNGFNYV